MTLQTETPVNAALAVQNAIASSAGSVAAGGMKQYVSFKIGGEEYAIDIMAVREIKGWTETTALPNQPEYILGVMNLRGIIVPVFDMRRRFGMGATEATRSHVVIIVAVLDRIVGLLVDAVSDILTIDGAEIRPVPEMDRGVATDFLSGIVSINESMVVILALEELFSRATVAKAFQEASEPQSIQ
jgi:purine-binding chemotaxis protein CheW